MAKEARLNTKLTMDDTQFHAALKSSQNAAGRFATGINNIMGQAGKMGLAAAGVGVAGLGVAFVASSRQAIELAGHLSELGKATGETAGNLAILERAFSNSGAGADKVLPSIIKMQDVIKSAGDGSTQAAGYLSKLGLSASDLAGKLPIEQMKIIADRIAGIQDPTERSNAALDIFGKKNGMIIPLLRNFSGEIEGAKAQLGSLPQILNESADSFDQFGDSLEALQKKGMEFSAGFLSEVLPELNKQIDSLTGKDLAGLGKSIGSIVTDKGWNKAQIEITKKLRDMADSAGAWKLGAIYQDSLDKLLEKRKGLLKEVAAQEEKATEAARKRKEIEKSTPAPQVSFSAQNELTKNRARAASLGRIRDAGGGPPAPVDFSDQNARVKNLARLRFNTAANDGRPAPTAPPRSNSGIDAYRNLQNAPSAFEKLQGLKATGDKVGGDESLFRAPSQKRGGVRKRGETREEFKERMAGAQKGKDAEQKEGAKLLSTTERIAKAVESW